MDGVELRKIDAHVHLVGDGSSGSGCWFRLPGIWKQFLGRLMIKGVGLPLSAMRDGLDSLYAENLVRQIQASSLDAAVVLAQDIPYDEHGVAMAGEAQFYVPNAYVAELARRHKEIIPACSIHPGRPDAMEELERCIDADMPIMKLLPNCLNVNYEEKRYKPFWERMAEAGMILLTHTGGELTVKVFDSSFGDPKKLAPVLDCGVTVIAAHAAGRSALFDPDWTDDLISMFAHYPHLYADNSAMCSLNRSRTLSKIMSAEIQQRIIHGSDYPVPVSGLGPFLLGKLAWRDQWRASKVKNILERDYLLKHDLGFESATFTRMDALLQRQKLRS